MDSGSLSAARIRKTPLVLQGIFLELMRLHFGLNSRAQFRWVEDIDETKIVIEPINSLNFSVVQKRPAIYVVRGAINYSQTHLGIDDVNRYDPKTGTTGQAILANGNVQFLPIDKNMGAVELLAEEISEVLLTFKSIICEDYNFTRMDLGSIQPVGVVQEDREFFTSPVSLNFEFLESWAVIPFTSLLRRITIGLRERLHDSRGSSDLPYSVGVVDTADPCFPGDTPCCPPSLVDQQAAADAAVEPPDSSVPGYGEGLYG